MSDKYGFCVEPKYTWKILIGTEAGSGVTFNMPGKPPNRFHRWMYKLLLGWRVEKV